MISGPEYNFSLIYKRELLWKRSSRNVNAGYEAGSFILRTYVPFPNIGPFFPLKSWSFHNPGTFMGIGALPFVRFANDSGLSNSSGYKSQVPLKSTIVRFEKSWSERSRNPLIAVFCRPVTLEQPVNPKIKSESNTNDNCFNSVTWILYKDNAWRRLN